MQLVDSVVDFLFDKVVDVGKVKQFQISNTKNDEILVKKNEKEVSNHNNHLNNSYDLNMEKFSPIANTSMNNVSINLRSSKYNNNQIVTRNNNNDEILKTNEVRENPENKKEIAKRIKTFGKPNNNTSLQKRRNIFIGSNSNFLKNGPSKSQLIKPGHEENDFYHPELTHVSSKGLEKLISDNENSFQSVSPKIPNRISTQKDSLKRSTLRIMRPSGDSNTSKEKGPIIHKLKGFKNSNKY